MPFASIESAAMPPVTSDDQAAAEKLLVEFDTRVIAQPLHFRSGREESAFTRISELFEVTRALLLEYPGANAFEWVVLRLLNGVIRPYTSRWQAWMVEDHFPGEQVRRRFRQELQELQRSLPPWRMALEHLANGKALGAEILEAIEITACLKSGGGVACLGTDELEAGIGDQIPFAGTPPESAAATRDGTLPSADAQVPAESNKLTPAQINRLERREIIERRALFGRREPPDSDDKLVNATGLALSGGGIRSATFCLGVAQALARRNFLPQFDYLSTVSGGGYLGAFLSCALGTEPKADPHEPAPAPTPASAAAKIDDAFRPEGQRESGLIRHLRNNSKYLLNGGASARLEIGGLVLSGIVSNLLMILPLPLIAAVVMFFAEAKAGYWGGAMFRTEGLLPAAQTPAAWVLLGLGVVFGALWVCLPLVQLLTHGDAPGSFGAALRRGWELLTLGLAASAALFAVIYFLPAIFEGYVELRAWVRGQLPTWLKSLPDAVSSVLGAVTVVLGVLASSLGPTWKRLRPLVVRLFILSGPLFFLSVFLFVGTKLGFRQIPAAGPLPWDHFWLVFGLGLGLMLWGWFFVNINTLAPHRYYRAKLCECYLIRRTPAEISKIQRTLRRAAGETIQGHTTALKQVPLTTLGTTGAAPYHLINTTVNLHSSKNKELRGRNGDFYVVSKKVCGSPLLGYTPTEDVQQTDPHFDLGTAMAVSGAAASAAMGWKTLPHFRFLMTLFNVRLGYWLPRVATKGRSRFLFSPGPIYLLREMAAKMDEHIRYINLSDGGHIENLGVYELLRRRCKFIVCVDAGMEPGMECADLIRLQRYAEIDLGIRMEFDLTDLKIETNGFSRAYAVLVLIDYNPPPNEVEARNRNWSQAQLGWMLYLKLSITGAEPAYVLDYRRENNAFPHESTGDQFYDEAQFEAYRRLGECAMNSLFRDELVGPNPPKTLKGWFQKLADNLIPDNHQVFKSASSVPKATPERTMAKQTAEIGL